MLIPIESEEGEEPLSKSSKETILRRHAESRYSDAVADAYASDKNISVKIPT